MWWLCSQPPVVQSKLHSQICWEVRMNMDEWFVKLGGFIYPLPNEVYLRLISHLQLGNPSAKKIWKMVVFLATFCKNRQYRFEMELESSS